MQTVHKMKGENKTWDTFIFFIYIFEQHSHHVFETNLPYVSTIDLGLEWNKKVKQYLLVAIVAVMLVYEERGISREYKERPIMISHELLIHLLLN